MPPEKRWLTVILLLFLLVGSSYALLTPVFEASDELWHYPLVEHLARGNPLPVQVFDPAEAGPWHQQASQPPLYYYLGAAVTFWIDTADMAQVRRLNPHVNSGVVTVDGNHNLVVHDPQATPWRGTLLAVRIVRMVSVLLGAVTVFLTYQIARELAPQRPEIALGAAAVNAFTPMFLFIGGAVNNDNLVIPLASLALLLLIRLVSRRPSFVFHSTSLVFRPSPYAVRLASFALIGVVIGLAALTKISGVGLLLLALGAVFMGEWVRSKGARSEGARSEGARSEGADPDRTDSARALVGLLLAALGWWAMVAASAWAIAGWWYLRNWLLYGDWTGWNAFIAVLGQRPQPATLAQLWSERSGFMASYWGLFGGLNLPLPEWIYGTLNALAIVAVVGLFLYLVRIVFSKISQITQMKEKSAQSLITHLFDFVAANFALVVCLLWVIAIVFGLIQWTTVTWSSQGRLAFTAISALSGLFVLGLVGWLPSRLARPAVVALAAFMFLVSAIAPWAIIRPAYQPPLVSAAELPPHEPLGAEFGGQMRLVGYAFEQTAVTPGGQFDLTLIWEAIAPMDRDWSVFVHLNDPVLNAPIAQRDMYPGRGLLATSFLTPGQLIVDRYRLLVPATAVAPAELDLVVGLYDYLRGERLLWADGRDALLLGAVELTAVPGEFPNATSVNFGNQLELAGFQLDPRAALPGEPMELELYWRVLRPLRANYSFSAQLVDLDRGDSTRWAAADLTPEGGTMAWPVGEVQTMTLTLVASADTPPQVYPLILAIYTVTESGGFERLQLVTPDGRVTDNDFLRLTQARVQER
jgi:hypothetical protein